MVWRRKGAPENLMPQPKSVLQDKLYLRRLAQVRRSGLLLCSGTMERVPSVSPPPQLNFQLVKRDPKELSIPTKQLNKKAAAHMIQGGAGPISIWQQHPHCVIFRGMKDMRAKGSSSSSMVSESH